jgi:thiamine-phosphate pyrophosphorylase
MLSKLRKQRQERFDQIDLYPVITQEFCKGRSVQEVLRQALTAKVRIVQLREKKISKCELYHQAELFRRLTADAGALLIINDHVDVALAVGADGVHLGQDDLPLCAARKIAPDLLLGVSTHNLEQADRATKDGADYINIGPIYPTGTKPEHDVFLGPEALAQRAGQVTIPFTVMGGIKPENLNPVLKAGARKIAVVTAVTAADDIHEACKALREQIQAVG